MAEGLKSPYVTNLDSIPVTVNTTGEGAPGYQKVATDSVNVVAPTQWSSYRLARFPTTAKVKKVLTYLQGIDSNGTATATLDFNVAFSDSTKDGTPADYQGYLPSHAADGTAQPFTLGTGYSGSYVGGAAANKLFGTVAVSNSGAIQKNLDITFNGSYSPAQRDLPMWNVFGFTNAQGSGIDPGGYFDIFAVMATASATAATGVIGIELDYVV